MRRDFVGNVSHEIKTPVTVIRGLAETLIDDPELEPSLRQRFLGKLDRQSERLLNLVTDLLSLSRLESEEAPLELSPLDVCDVLEESLRLIEPIVRAAMHGVWKAWAAQHSGQVRDLSMHQRLTQCFEQFGESSLTQREREITQLLLRGHSSKSVARELDIAPGTVMVHKRNLFSKLGITSQYELFSLFIDRLSAL